MRTRLRLRGGRFTLEVWVHDGQHKRLVDSGDEVFAGERVAFRVSAATAGHLLIVGVDQSGEVYLCYPRRGRPVVAHRAGF